MAKTICFLLLACGILVFGSVARGVLLINPVELVTWQCPNCGCGNVTDAGSDYHPKCRHCSDALGWNEWDIELADRESY
ncbi:hypothetical protein [Calycomorphotria hydatis]|uniref:hypothetical protein n=1 Tax=Calycomorphotria hydatis TaxID=2528027 RepID=UPI0011A6C128|nr:hypothetical protein [Calycomorphotria hydatis]